MPPRRDRRAERGHATRAALLGAARELFAARGYAQVTTTELVDRAGVTRGAMYHHFADKRALFRALYEELEAEVTQQVAEAVAGDPSPDRHLETGIEAYLDACLEPAYRRIALLEAPSVLGYEEWRGTGAEFSLGLLRAALEAAMEIGRIERQPVDPLAHLILGALAEAALMIARADHPDLARTEVGRSVLRLLAGLAPTTPS